MLILYMLNNNINISTIIIIILFKNKQTNNSYIFESIKKMKNNIIRLVIQGTAAYCVYQCFVIINK